MSKKDLLSILSGAMVAIALLIAMGGCLYYCTSAESWYAGMHDEKCEKTLYGEKCHCYERFVEKEKGK